MSASKYSSELGKIFAVTVFTLLAGLGGATDAKSESVEGFVQIKGSGLNSKTYVISEDSTQKHVICRSDFEQKLRHLTDLVIQVHGDWRLSPTGERDCLQGLRYEPVHNGSGRPLVAGTLSYRSGVYIVSEASGREVILADVPDGVRSFLGGKVILDVKSIASPNAAEAVKVVVSYRPMP